MKRATRRKLLWALLAVAVLIPYLIYAPRYFERHASPKPGLVDGRYVVSRVIDGDTIELANVGRLRFRDFDAPELDQPGGPEAAQRLREAIAGGPVYVEFARRQADGMPIHDKYGRLLGDLPELELEEEVENDRAD